MSFCLLSTQKEEAVNVSSHVEGSTKAQALWSVMFVDGSKPRRWRGRAMPFSKKK